jgi:hypothetical protein
MGRDHTLEGRQPACVARHRHEPGRPYYVIPQTAQVAKLDRLTVFGLFAVTAMLVTYALEDRSSWFILAFAGACALGSVYGFLQGAWPFGLVEAIWCGVALRRWYRKTSAT